MSASFELSDACVQFRANGSAKHRNLSAWGAKDYFIVGVNTDLLDLDSWLKSKKGTYVFTALSFELYQLLPFFSSLEKKDNLEPLAIFWEAEHVQKNPPEVPLDYSLQVGAQKQNHTKEAYLENINRLKKHIRLGDFYITNFCTAYTWEKCLLDNPYGLYDALNQKTTAPFSVYFKFKEHHILSASPERFIKKTGDLISSSPIKGTIKRGLDDLEDERLQRDILANKKELAENVMIVDLVRNDLSRIAEKASVEVSELNRLYSYKTVHQLISTVSAKLKSNTPFSELLNALYPMGSMTGAPKLESLKITKALEGKPRGFYSGSVGFIDPDGNFDFNVVIRSLYYNQAKESLHLGVGSAITSKSDAHLEWEECQLKAKALLDLVHEHTRTSRK